MDLRGDLQKHTHLGNLEIVRYIPDGGIKIRGWLGEVLLAEACRKTMKISLIFYLNVAPTQTSITRMKTD
ncbi:hypothetical protein OCU04_008395 [Sclerotinia nivalis]|uniref:Uncharacterized protein n=1 Tax=Sclerotinia nivalis TaxID=352851 RepID=A0A9X0AHZ2_9HELO|nr:hypothetical protein OCU04_008395 [Sclerotinia nivalis]